MKKVPTSKAKLFFVLSVLLSSVSWTTAYADLNDFLQCLPKFSESSYPIIETIYTHKNTSFQYVLNAYIQNRRYSTPTIPKPMAIIAAMHESHVQATVVCAKQHALHIRIRSGGHDYEGLSYVSSVPFIILDMFNLRSIEINVTDESAWVQAGATAGELYYKIAEKSKVHGFPAGVCPTVATGGLISGGGYGPTMRKFGLSADNIEDAKLVNVNGTILYKNSMGEDLFWAIRGGGGASFGVILSWKIKLVRVPAKVTVFNVTRSIEQGALDVLYRWQYVAPKLPKNTYIRATSQVSNGEGKKKAVEVSFSGHFLGQIDELLRLINESFPELGLQRKDCFEMSWVESTVFWAGYPIGTPINVLLNRTNIPTFFFKSKSDYVKEPIPKEGIESIWQMVQKIEKVYVQWNPYGGRMDEIATSATPFPHRAGNLFKIQYYMSWTEEGIETTNNYLSFSRKLYEEMTPFVSKNPREAFLNYRDIDIGANLHNQTEFDIARVYGSKFFKDNFDRLVRVKTVVDPQNFFRNEQSIPPL
ncbi:berberine bridge enzyme-like 7 [Prunus dulcis]|uniref:berberine bridge enzyme-like 7 n=1 Tax=Prunus dulcis TaxID=3755 RepID=UPI0014827D86|nr:berberine bridge enzyme-like 7 [Prunus dulcis]